MGCPTSKEKTPIQPDSNNNKRNYSPPSSPLSQHSATHSNHINKSNNNNISSNISNNGKYSPPSSTQSSTSPRIYPRITRPEEEAVYVGLDFGTIYSSISLWKGEKPYLIELQGVDRILSLVESSNNNENKSERQAIGKVAMELYGSRAQRVIISPKPLIEKEKNPELHKATRKFIAFLKEQALAVDNRINSVVVCIPATYNKRVLMQLLQQEFPVSRIFISDIAAVYLCYSNEGQHNLQEDCFVISFGGGYFSGGLVTLDGSTISVNPEYVVSYPGGNVLVKKMMELVLFEAKLRMNTVRSKGRLWYQCMKKMEVIYGAEVVEFEDMSMLGSEVDSVEIRYSMFKPTVDTFLHELGKILYPVLYRIPPTTKIIVSGGMCNFLPFRLWLDALWPNRVQEMFSLNNSCVKGTAYRIKLSSFTLKDCL